MRTVWAHVAPHLPQPATDADVLVSIHMARTASESMPLRDRAYSHRWLTERGYPSQLPDRLKPSAERLYPRVVKAVGISVNSKYPIVVQSIRGAMEDAVNDCYANGDTATEIVKPQMMAARAREQRSLFGIRTLK